MTKAEDNMQWQELKLDREVIGFSRQLSDCTCIVVKLEVWDLPFYFAEHLQEDNVMRFGGARIRPKGCRPWLEAATCAPRWRSRVVISARRTTHFCPCHDPA